MNSAVPAATTHRRMSASASSSQHQQQQRRLSAAPSQHQQLEAKQQAQFRNSLQSQQEQQSQQKQEPQPLLNGGGQHHHHASASSSAAAAAAAADVSGGVSSTRALTHRKNSSSRKSSSSSNNNNNQEEESHRSMNNNHDHSNTNIYSTKNTPLRNVIDAYQMLRYKSGKIVNNNKVQLFIVSLIALNAIMMGIGTYPFIKDNPTAMHVFEIIDLTFLIIFTIELFMQFLFHGWRLILDGWLVFDLIIIVTSWSFSEMQIIRAFRIFRALRLITRVKVMKNLVLALFGVMPRMFAIGILLLLVSYIFAVMFTQLFKDLYERELTTVDYFGRMDNTFFTLFQIMTLDAWAEVAREVMAVYAWAWLPFIIFVIITAFVVVNLIIAVICDAIAALHDDEKAKLHGTYEDEHPEYYDEHGNYIGDDPELLAAQEHARQQERHHQENVDDDDDDNPNAQVETTRTLAAESASFRSNNSKHNAAAANINSASSSSQSTMSQQRSNVEAQLDKLELFVEDLTKMQEQTILTLEILTKELQAQRAARQGAAGAAAAAALGAA